MRFFAVVGITLLVIFIVNVADVAVQLHLKDNVYACSEVTKNDPINVQQICKKAWKRNE